MPKANESTENARTSQIKNGYGGWRWSESQHTREVCRHSGVSLACTQSRRQLLVSQVFESCSIQCRFIVCPTHWHCRARRTGYGILTQRVIKRASASEEESGLDPMNPVFSAELWLRPASGRRTLFRDHRKLRAHGIPFVRAVNLLSLPLLLVQMRILEITYHFLVRPAARQR
jgi:hypothetical protein